MRKTLIAMTCSLSLTKINLLSQLLKYHMYIWYQKWNVLSIHMHHWYVRTCVRYVRVTKRHDSMRDRLATVLGRVSGTSATVEPRVLQPQDSADQRRGDIKVSRHGNTWILDVGVVCPGTQRYVDQGSGTMVPLRDRLRRPTPRSKCRSTPTKTTSSRLSWRQVVASTKQPETGLML